jgi:hypothetical protein
MKFKTTFVYKVLALLCSLLLLSACATTTEPKASNIEERVTARWKTLLGGDLAGSYEYLSPGYRSSVSSLQFQRNILLQKVQWTDAKYMSSECTETICNVKVLVGFTVSGAIPGMKRYEGTKQVEESWLLVDDLWYFLPGR